MIERAKIVQAIALLREAAGISHEIVCPFCGDDDFDKIGLKIHFERGHCDEYEETPTQDPEPEAS